MLVATAVGACGADFDVDGDPVDELDAGAVYWDVFVDLVGIILVGKSWIVGLVREKRTIRRTPRSGPFAPLGVKTGVLMFDGGLAVSMYRMLEEMYNRVSSLRVYLPPCGIILPGGSTATAPYAILNSLST